MPRFRRRLADADVGLRLGGAGCLLRAVLLLLRWLALRVSPRVAEGEGGEAETLVRKGFPECGGVLSEEGRGRALDLHLGLPLMDANLHGGLARGLSRECDPYDLVVKVDVDVVAQSQLEEIGGWCGWSMGRVGFWLAPEKRQRSRRSRCRFRRGESRHQRWNDVRFAWGSPGRRFRDVGAVRMLFVARVRCGGREWSRSQRLQGLGRQHSMELRVPQGRRNEGGNAARKIATKREGEGLTVRGPGCAGEEALMAKLRVGVGSLGKAEANE